jgi:hypothetical protein
MKVKIRDKFKRDDGKVFTINEFISSGCQGDEVILTAEDSDNEEIKENLIWFGLPGGWKPTLLTRIKMIMR